MQQAGLFDCFAKGRLLGAAACVRAEPLEGAQEFSRRVFEKPGHA